MTFRLNQGSAELEASSFDSSGVPLALRMQSTVDPSMPCESGFSPTQKIKVGESATGGFSRCCRLVCFPSGPERHCGHAPGRLLSPWVAYRLNQILLPNHVHHRTSVLVHSIDRTGHRQSENGAEK